MKLKHMKKENGQAMVEFALVLPILLLFIGAIIDFGWIFHNQLVANNASREAARYIAIHYYYDNMDEASPLHYSAGSAEEYAYNIIDGYMNLVDFDINDIEQIIPENDDANDGQKIKVKFTGEVYILTPILATIIDNDNDGKYPLKAECTMRVEQ